MSDSAKQKRLGRQRRHNRVRKKVRGTDLRPRLAVYRSNRHIGVQLIDDIRGVTLAHATTLESSQRSRTGGDIEAAAQVGKLIATRAKDAGVEKVVFDRGGFRYQGRVAALAEAAREGGLEF